MKTIGYILLSILLGVLLFFVLEARWEAFQRMYPNATFSDFLITGGRR